MRGQWSLILGLIAAVLIAVFAVVNVEAVRVNYVFGTADWPLILVILGSVLMGAIIVGAVGMFKIYQLQAEMKRLKTKQMKEDGDVHSRKKEKDTPAYPTDLTNKQNELYQSKEKTD
ncbi:hypothetical protein JCM9140_2785 [Halalkalibacter wakoensis JCM 9140]|uniref:Lipopolysaccharide assembly protein A domain-containing protein n=1 Tax=Halalkalibacter wakoensis JCM 9140 TaxID=1236970 RepID=W4Q4Q4_9BACI|nr:lipopolysaccharide assembly LapA domain-containing protein [Halalkalibacter wakoensis]GAE26698.1 hypothetical protein JCM9140_2785 [Halalkalibacter wakoensis JCM 9140]